MPERDDDTIHALMTELAAEFAGGAVDVDDVMATVTAAAVELIDGVDYADVLLIEGGDFRSVAPTDPIAVALDDLQQTFREGPCLEAASFDATIRSPDLSDETRWPDFAVAAVEHGVRSTLSFQLFTRGEATGALNLLGKDPHSFSVEAEGLAAMLATHVAVALEAANNHRQFESALASRDTIGQAKGMLMERFGIDAVQAFELLKRLSQESNVPVRELAVQVVQRH